MQQTKDSLLNRRHDPRIRCFKRSLYIDGSGTTHRTEILNTSNGGARITTDTKVKVGDKVRLQEERNGKSEDSLVEVRWTEPLPGGLRLVVGVMRLVI